MARELADPRIRILGIDPGTRVVGWGIIDVVGSRHHLVAYGAIAPPPRSPIEGRLGIISQEIQVIVAEHQPMEVAIEDVFHAKSAKAAIRLGEGRGAAIAAVTPLPVFPYSANEVKKAVTGKGGKAKEAVARMVALLLGMDEPPSSLDASDGLALALCHANRRRTIKLLESESG
jgi:crossover junction endodeoxyribonuclease RuvC